MRCSLLPLGLTALVAASASAQQPHVDPLARAHQHIQHANHQQHIQHANHEHIQQQRSAEEAHPLRPAARRSSHRAQARAAELEARRGQDGWGSLHGGSESSTLARRQGPNGLQAPSQDEQDAVVQLAATDPVGAANMALQLPGLYQANNWYYKNFTLIPTSSTGGIQLPVNADIPYIANADATYDQATGGWKGLPAGFAGWALNRSFSVTNADGEQAVMPFYANADYDPALIQKTIIVWPGKPRDAWAYTNYVANALNIVATRGLNAEISNKTVLVLGPAWMNDADLAAGAAQPGELTFHGSQWNSGGVSHTPASLAHSMTSYEVLDAFLDMVFENGTFPNMKQALVLGHSMGAQATQRYALLKKTKAYDPNVAFWIGNPGSYAWLTTDTPHTNASCPTAGVNASCASWHYGIYGNQSEVTKYARADVIANASAVVERFRNRRVHYAFALLDNGAGDTHPEAQLQGASHLERGAQFVKSLAAMPGGFPQSHTVDFVANTSHQDYAMISTSASLQRIFLSDWGVSYPPLRNVTNPGDKPKDVPKPKAFATPGHERMALSLLLGSIGVCAAAFCALPLAFRAKSFTPEEDAYRFDKAR